MPLAGLLGLAFIPDDAVEFESTDRIDATAAEQPLSDQGAQHLDRVGVGPPYGVMSSVFRVSPAAMSLAHTTSSMIRGLGPSWARRVKGTCRVKGP
ncbi:hypothetical protein [Nonomuraea sp. NPDC050643]|uniref:hypothetical protein n=1 Tax=Nonomuraea sp. NPDC050643 TaxID=3155660 RepID=UPI00340F744B